MNISAPGSGTNLNAPELISLTSASSEQGTATHTQHGGPHALTSGDGSVGGGGGGSNNMNIQQGQLGSHSSWGSPRGSMFNGVDGGVGGVKSDSNSEAEHSGRSIGEVPPKMAIIDMQLKELFRQQSLLLRNQAEMMEVLTNAIQNGTRLASARLMSRVAQQDGSGSEDNRSLFGGGGGGGAGDVTLDLMNDILGEKPQLPAPAASTLSATNVASQARRSVFCGTRTHSVARQKSIVARVGHTRMRSVANHGRGGGGARTDGTRRPTFQTDRNSGVVISTATSSSSGVSGGGAGDAFSRSSSPKTKGEDSSTGYAQSPEKKPVPSIATDSDESCVANSTTMYRPELSGTLPPEDPKSVTASSPASNEAASPTERNTEKAVSDGAGPNAKSAKSKKEDQQRKKSVMWGLTTFENGNGATTTGQHNSSRASFMSTASVTSQSRRIGLPNTKPGAKRTKVAAGAVKDLNLLHTSKFACPELLQSFVLSTAGDLDHHGKEDDIKSPLSPFALLNASSRSSKRGKRAGGPNFSASASASLSTKTNPVLGESDRSQTAGDVVAPPEAVSNPLAWSGMQPSPEVSYDAKTNYTPLAAPENVRHPPPHTLPQRNKITKAVLPARKGSEHFSELQMMLSLRSKSITSAHSGGLFDDMHHMMGSMSHSDYRRKQTGESGGETDLVVTDEKQERGGVASKRRRPTHRQGAMVSRLVSHAQQDTTTVKGLLTALCCCCSSASNATNESDEEPEEPTYSPSLPSEHWVSTVTDIGYVILSTVSMYLALSRFAFLLRDETPEGEGPLYSLSHIHPVEVIILNLIISLLTIFFSLVKSITQVRHEDWEVHDNATELRGKYIRSCWFIVDLLTIVPFEFIFINWLPTGFAICMLRHLLRLPRMLTLYRSTHPLQDSRQWFTIAFIMSVSVLIIEIAALLFHRLDPSSPTHLDALYWTVTTITSVGYGDVLPTAGDTKYLSICVQFCGIIIISAVTSVVTQFLTATDPISEDIQRRKKIMYSMLRFYDIPWEVQKEVIALFPSILADHNEDQFNEMAQNLPQAVGKKMEVFLRRKLIANVPIFSELKDNGTLLLELAASLSSEMYEPGDYIMQAGDEGKEMYFIASGGVEVLVPLNEEVETVVAVLRTGQWFGEVALLEPDNIRSVSVEATEVCEVLVLDQEVFFNVAAKYPALMALLNDEFAAKQEAEQNLPPESGDDDDGSSSLPHIQGYNIAVEGASSSGVDDRSSLPSSDAERKSVASHQQDSQQTHADGDPREVSTSLGDLIEEDSMRKATASFIGPE